MPTTPRSSRSDSPRRAFAGLAAAAAIAALPTLGVGPATAARDQAGRAAAAAPSLVLYSTLAKKGYVNNADDRSRGKGTNPFGNYSGSYVTPPDNAAVYGPFPGDEGLFAYTLFSDAAHTKSAGSAMVICQYDFDRDAFCDASLQLGRGVLIGKGTIDFDAPTATLAVVGGTKAYRGSRGTVLLAGLGKATQKQPVARVVPFLQQQRLSISAQAASPTHTITAYSAPDSEIFVNNDDDEQRGDVNNAFATHNPNAANAKEGSNGPFAGDEAFFSFELFSTPDLKTKIGSAVYTCQYSFDKNAFCDASFSLKGGTIIGGGPLNYNAPAFSLAVIGGAGTFGGIRGDVAVTASGKHAQRLSFSVR